MAILMCRPDYFGIEYEINPWMRIEVPADHGIALAQWERLYATFVSLGQEIVLIEPVRGLPDMVFTANAGLVWDGNVVLSSFRHPERQGEEPHFKRAFEQLGLRVHELPKPIAFEGAGDGLFVGDRLYFGHGFRTDPAAQDPVGHALGVQVIPLQLADPRFYHLDTCFCPINGTTVLFAPHAFSAESAEAIRATVPHAIEVPPSPAEGFACNAMPVEGTIVSSDAIGALASPLQAAGYDILGLPMTEFMKSGGGVRCLSLPLDVGRR